MRNLKILEKNRGFWFAIISSFLFFLLRFPSLFEPYWYGDEGIYQAIGISLNHGKLLYKEIFDNKPPFLYLTYSILGSDQFWVRLLSLGFGLASVIVFFFLTKKLFSIYKKNAASYIGTSVFALLFGLPILEGNIANSENFMLLPIITAALLVINFAKPTYSKPSTQKLLGLFTIGLLLSTAFLYKVVAVFDLGAFLVFLGIVNFDFLKKSVKEFFLILSGFSLPIILTALFFIFNGALIDFIKATFTSNVSYVSYGNKIGGSPILLFVKLTILAGFLLYLFRKRKSIDKTELFIFIWVAFSIFNALFSQRPYAHYVLVLLPSASLLFGLIYLGKQYQKKIAIIFIILFIFLFNSFAFYGIKKSFAYYQNFISFIYRGKATASYQAFFDKKTPVDYEIALFIKPRLGKNDTIFVWGNNAQLYKLTETIPITKYIVAYHITNYKDGIPITKTSLERTKPKFIVVMSNQIPIPFSLVGYLNVIQIDNALIYERIF